MIIDCIVLEGVEYAVPFLWRTPDLQHMKEENSLRRIVEWFYSVLEECARIITQDVKAFVDRRG